MAELLAFPGQELFNFSSEPFNREVRDTLDLSDTESRQAALDIQQSWIVEAPAGSGKTGLLIQRYLKLLAMSGARRPEEILAITFTRKASGELRTRVLEQLVGAATNAPLPSASSTFERTTRELALAVLRRDRLLGWRLLDSPHSFNISTIDAFCRQLASSRPLLASGAGRYQPVDDASLLYEQAAERTVRQLGGDDKWLDEALRTVLALRDALIGDVIALLADMLGAREQWGALVPLNQGPLSDAILDGEVRPRLEATLEKAVCDVMAEAADGLGEDLLGRVTRLAARLGSAPGYRGEASPIAYCAGLTHPPAVASEAFEHWKTLLYLLLKGDGEWRNSLRANHLKIELGGADAEELEQLLTEVKARAEVYPGLRETLCAVRELPSSSYPDDQWRIVKALFRVLRHALAELNLLFAERGSCDFTEIGLTARELLRSGPDLPTLPGAGVNHILIDEMQDTSAGQYELLHSLTRSWDGASQTVFLVGDPKQSIYLFRQARVARFLRTQMTGLFGDIRLGALRLTANFRSQAHLVTSFNDLFMRILPAPEELRTGRPDQVEVPFVAAEPARAPGANPAVHWHTRRVAPDDRPSGDSRAQPADPGAAADASDLRRAVEEFRERWNQREGGAATARRPPRIAVLARSRAHLAPVIAEFRRENGTGPIPFRAVEIERLDEQREVLDLLALTRALLHPGDRLAWLAVLRSPVCGLELADLLALCGEGPGADSASTVVHLVGTRTDRLSVEGRLLLGRVWPTLSAALTDKENTSLATTVERTWRSLGADAPLHAGQLSNAGRYLTLLRDLEGRPEPINLPALERALKHLYAEPLANAEAVDLMTIHKAKGLEWDLVLLPALHRETGNNQHELLRWLELDGEHGGEADVMLSPIQGKGEESSRLSRWLGGLQTSREAAETKRLLYVACTRAREELHLFTAVSVKRDGSLATPRAGTLLRAAWPAAQPVLSQLLTFPPSQPGISLEAPLGPASAQSLLTLAAAADPTAPTDAVSRPMHRLERLPLSFNPLDRFRPENGPGIPYTPSELLRHEAPFARPEGSFAARAFGNVVHRHMELLADMLKTEPHDEVTEKIRRWSPRLEAALRAEGLPPSTRAREAVRVLGALQGTLADPYGRWVLSPHLAARNELSLEVRDGAGTTALGGTLRADRTFVAGPDPLETEAGDCLWIVDYKTAELGGRRHEVFLKEEQAKYAPQMHAYAQAMYAASDVKQPIVLALYYSLIPHLLYWPYDLKKASEFMKHRTW